MQVKQGSITTVRIGDITAITIALSSGKLNYGRVMIMMEIIIIQRKVIITIMATKITTSAIIIVIIARIIFNYYCNYCYIYYCCYYDRSNDKLTLSNIKLI